ncbi:MAG: AI-2E family transporter [Candidatus Saccharimonadales bacterium]
MKVHIDVDRKTFINFGLVVLVFVTSLFLIIKAREPLAIIGVSIFLALALNPPVSYIARRLPGRSRVMATALSYIAVLAFLGTTLFLVVPPVVEQSSKFASTVPEIIDQVTSQRHLIDDFVTRYGLEQQLDSSIENAKSQASAVANDIGKVLVNGATGLFNGALTMIFILVLTFLMLIEGPDWMKKIWGLYQDPVRLERHRSVVSKMYRVVVGYVNGQLLVALIAAMTSLVVILLLSLLFPLPANLALPLATIIFLMDLIPMVGATLGAVVVTLILSLNDTTAAIIFAVYFFVYQQVENNFIAPVIQSKKVELSALSVLVAILIGVSIFGLIGGLISIPIAGCIRVLMVDYLEHAEKERAEKADKNPIAKLAAKLKN